MGSAKAQFNAQKLRLCQSRMKSPKVYAAVAAVAATATHRPLLGGEVDKKYAGMDPTESSASAQSKGCMSPHARVSGLPERVQFCLREFVRREELRLPQPSAYSGTSCLAIQQVPRLCTPREWFAPGKAKGTRPSWDMRKGR